MLRISRIFMASVLYGGEVHIALKELKDLKFEVCEETSQYFKLKNTEGVSISLFKWVSSKQGVSAARYDLDTTTSDGRRIAMLLDQVLRKAGFNYA